MRAQIKAFIYWTGNTVEVIVHRDDGWQLPLQFHGARIDELIEAMPAVKIVVDQANTDWHEKNKPDDPDGPVVETASGNAESWYEITDEEVSRLQALT